MVNFEQLNVGWEGYSIVNKIKRPQSMSIMGPMLGFTCLQCFLSIFCYHVILVSVNGQ